MLGGYFSASALVNVEDMTLQFLLQNPIDALLAMDVAPNEYLLVFSS